MRLSIDISDDLHRDVKVKAANEGKTIAQVVRPMLERFAQGTVDVHAAKVQSSSPGADWKPISKSDQAKGTSRKK